MGGKKKVKPCGYIKPHKAHTWSRDESAANLETGRVWCRGIGEQEHRHLWDFDQPVLEKPVGEGELRQVAQLGERGVPWEGPLECTCGQSAWLSGGRKKRSLKTAAADARYPEADALQRILALKAKVDKGGPEALDDHDKEELQAIADGLIAAMQPLIEALGEMFKQAALYIQNFLDRINPETMTKLVELSKAYGEKPDEIETIDIVDSSGAVIETRTITPASIAAVNAIDLQDDSDFNSSLVASPAHISSINPLGIVRNMYGGR